MDDPVTEYANNVVDGTIPACKYVIQACKRHLHDLAAGQYVFDLKAANFSIGFSRILKHFKGKYAGKNFEPEPWQMFIKGSIFGWKNEMGVRRFRFAYIEVPRKNGKTFMAADIGIQGLVADNEAGAEVYCVATKRDQAKLVFDDAKSMVSKCPCLAKRTNIFRSLIELKHDPAKFLPLSRDTKSMDGLNPHFAIGDEVHAWEDDMLFRQMKDGMGARTQPLFLLITTAGHNIDGICFRLREHSISILDGFKSAYVDDEFFTIIYTLDDEDDWTNEESWSKANPNLGVSKSIKYLRSEVKLAKQIPSEEYGVKNKQFNIWTSSDLKWLDLDRWDDCGKPYDLAALVKQPCHLGIDLSSIRDLTAVITLFPPGPYPEFTVLPRLYLPEERLHLREREDRRPYLDWHKKGFIITTPGDVIDLDFIRRDILTLADTYNVIDAGFDPWKAIELATSLQAEGLEMVQMRQGHATLGAPTLALEKLVLEKQLRHGGNPVLRWMASNTSVKRDINDNIRPDKSATKARIDGIVALVMALGRALVRAEEPSPTAHIIDL